MAKQKRVLITGAAGFTGTHLANLLSKDMGIELYLSGSAGKNTPPAGFRKCDFLNAVSVRTLIPAIKPDEIYHLIGTFTNRFDVDVNSNVNTTKNILETLREEKLQSRVLIVGSSAEYGFPDNADEGVKETHPLLPVSIYGLLKVYQTKLMEMYIRMYGMDIVGVRPFNLFGEGISTVLFVGNLQKQIGEYARGTIRSIATGNLSVERDYIDISRATEYYRTVMERGKTGEMYNIGSGKSVTLRTVAEKMLQSAGLPLNIIMEGTHETPGKIVVPKIFADITKLKALI